jgi:hypothetical protein
MASPSQSSTDALDVDGAESDNFEASLHSLLALTDPTMDMVPRLVQMEAFFNMGL